MKKTLLFFLAALMALSLGACSSTKTNVVERDNQTSITAGVVEAAIPPESEEGAQDQKDRLSISEANSLFNAEYKAFDALTDEIVEAINFYSEENLNTLEKLQNYESMWETISDKYRAIETALSNKNPPKIYEEKWDSFTTCMGKIADAVSKCQDFNLNNDDTITGEEIINSLSEMADVFEEQATQAVLFANELQEISVKNTSPSTPSPSHSIPPQRKDYSFEEKNAIQSARNYIAHQAFSRSGLIKQLEFEGYSSSSAKVAVDSLNIDWNKQAVSCAKQYLSTMSFSRSGLIDQLIYEGFSNSQAEYAARTVGY